MKPGETLEAAIWIDGRETEEQRKRFEADVTETIDTVCTDHGMVRGPVRFIEKDPLDDRAPAVPDHIKGPNVRLLIAEADLIGRRPKLKHSSFLTDLDRIDLERLRKATRAAYAVSAPNGNLTDEECDRIIEELGPRVAEQQVRRAVDSGAVH